jgi:hypothetical protein
MLKPRIQSSIKQPGKFPEDLLKLVKDTFTETYKTSIEPNENFYVEGAIYPHELIIRITLMGDIKTISCSASMPVQTKKYNLSDHVHVMIDTMGSFFDEYFKESRQLLIEEGWKKYSLDENTVIYLNLSTKNEYLEDQANKLLKKE